MAHISIFLRGFDNAVVKSRAHQREAGKCEYTETRGSAVYLLIRRATL